jgi:ATP-dependent DNA helicase RecG
MTADGMETRSENLGNAGREDFSRRALPSREPGAPPLSVRETIARHRQQTKQADGQAVTPAEDAALNMEEDASTEQLPIGANSRFVRPTADRGNDRLIVETNLIDSYDLLMGFAKKHLLDKFYLEDDKRVSLSNVISREMLVNCLMHREFTSSYIAQFVIEKDRMYTANANRAETGEIITPDNFRPNPKNPIIAAFFRNIWYADELGSGVRNLYRYGRLYSGKTPEMLDGDVFKIVVPLDDSYSFDAQIGKAQNKAQIKRSDDCALFENLILNYLRDNPQATQIETAKAIGKSRRAVQDAIALLKENGLLAREGARKNGRWTVNQQPGKD